LDEVRAAGYPDGYTQRKDHVRAVRPMSEPVVPFETPPGVQAQMGFAELIRLPCIST